MITNWLVRFNGTSDTTIIAAPTAQEAIMQAEESSMHAVRSVQFHSAGICISTEAMNYEALESVANC